MKSNTKIVSNLLKLKNLLNTILLGKGTLLHIAVYPSEGYEKLDAVGTSGASRRRAHVQSKKAGAQPVKSSATTTPSAATEDAATEGGSRNGNISDSSISNYNSTTTTSIQQTQQNQGQQH